MVLLAEIYQKNGREAERHLINADATLRHPDQRPLDILISDLSTTGCQFISSERLVLGATVMIGLAGLGRRAARIVRTAERRYGCEFVEPLHVAEVAAAQARPENQVVNLPIWPRRAGSGHEVLPRVTQWPGPMRLAVLLVATAAAWSALIALASVFA